MIASHAPTAATISALGRRIESNWMNPASPVGTANMPPPNSTIIKPLNMVPRPTVIIRPT